MTDLTCTLLVIGAGPGGYVAAIRAGQLGLDTIVVDPAPPGGTSLNSGCVPSKALIYAGIQAHRVRSYTGASHLGITVDGFDVDLATTMAWKDGMVDRLSKGVVGLLKNAGARLIRGHAEFIDGKSVTVTAPDGARSIISAGSVLIATGAEPVELPDLPFGDQVISSTGALSLTQVPEQLVVVGAGAAGLELGTAYTKLGAKVTVLEDEPRVLPGHDVEVSRVVARRCELLGMRLLTGTRPLGMPTPGAVRVAIQDRHLDLPADTVLVCVGRRPRTTGMSLEGLNLTMSGDAIAVDEHCRTSMRAVYAVGDVTGGPMAAHRAMAQGQMVAEIVAGKPAFWDRRSLTTVTFTDPEIVSAGMDPEQADAAGIDTVVGRFPLRGNARALMQEDTGGFIRVVARADDHLVLGAQAVGTNVSELSAALALVLENGLRLEDINGTIQAHPTQAEAFGEASLLALGPALHI